MLALELYHLDPDMPVTETMFLSVTAKLERKINTVFELSRGYAVYKDQQDELFTSDLHYLSELYGLCDTLALMHGSVMLEISLVSSHGDMFVRQHI